jgi:two-component system OmpR family response regulator
VNASADILIAEDDRSLLEVLKYNISKEGYNVLTATDGAQALELARSEKPQLIILDVMLPRMDGFEVCRVLRQESATPILMLTAKSDEVDKVVGLEIGADDYMTKPFSVRELLARIKAMLRRASITTQSPSAGEAPLVLGNLKIDTGQHSVTLDGKVLTLAPREFEMLLYLVRNRGLVLSREQILNKVWGYDYPGGTRTVDVHVRWLRQKIETDPSDPERLLTVRGVGYKMEG